MVGRGGESMQCRAGGRHVAVALALAVLAGCSTRAVAPTPGHPQSGIASWYGPGFHGQPTSSGAIYDQHALTAAHQKLPLGTRARVTNLENGKSVEVLINDRGPFAKGRIIDLSYGAAREIGMIGPGTARVRVDVVARPANGASHVAYCVQVGAFGDEDKARALRARLAPSYDDVYISPVQAQPERMPAPQRVYRVRVGPYAERTRAEYRAAALADLGLPAVVTEEPQQ
ncbi:MAG: septal ring lytic transglycosylase RlpA family protein [Deltaproteobacteria bacterium]|nr:septal ring lytic transglycosylase RlpA family protein [Deltaproteobacteria bacterium]